MRSVVFQYMVAFFHKVFLGFLGTNAKGSVLIGNAVPGKEPLNPVFLGCGDGNGHIADLSQTAVKQLNGINGAEPITIPLTEEQKAIIIECVNNAVKNPFEVTPSAYPGN